MQLSAMPILSNQRRERFSQHIAQGANGAAAYRNTYGACGASAETNASRLMRNDKVRERVRELQTKVEKETVLTMQRRRELLRERAESAETTATALVAIVLADARLAGELPDLSDRKANRGDLPSAVPKIIMRNYGDPGWEPRQPVRPPDVEGEEPAPIIFNVPKWWERRRGEADEDAK